MAEESGHALAVMAAIERAQARRMEMRNAPHVFVPMPDGRCNLCHLWTVGPRHLLGERHGLIASVLADRRTNRAPRLSVASPLGRHAHA